MTITSGKKTKVNKYASGRFDEGATVADLEQFMLAVHRAGIPSDTKVCVPGSGFAALFGPLVPITALHASVDVEEPS